MGHKGYPEHIKCVRVRDASKVGGSRSSFGAGGSTSALRVEFLSRLHVWFSGQPPALSSCCCAKYVSVARKGG